jgi:hypothetical protein
VSASRDRIREAIADNCVASIDPERYADAIAAAVPTRNDPDLAEDLIAEARRIARERTTDGLLTRGA